MSSLLYKGHSISYGATLDETTREYAPTFQIAWQAIDGKRDVHSFTALKRFSTFYDANTAAVEEAIAWADRRLMHREP
jgi:hypothetical protein